MAAEIRIILRLSELPVTAEVLLHCAPDWAVGIACPYQPEQRQWGPRYRSPTRCATWS